MLRLPWGVKQIFEQWLETHYPEHKDKVLSRVRALRGGKLYDSTWGGRGVGTGFFAQQIASLFDASERKYGLDGRDAGVSTAAFRRPTAQGDLFG